MGNNSNVLSMKKGEKGIIRALDMSKPQRTRKLMALGILPGMQVGVIQRFPTWVLQVGNTQVALDDDCASCIMVDKMQQ